MNFLMESYAALQPARRNKKPGRMAVPNVVFSFVTLALFLLPTYPAMSENTGASQGVFEINLNDWNTVGDAARKAGTGAAQASTPQEPEISVPTIEIKNTDSPAADNNPGTSPLDPFLIKSENWKNAQSYAKEVDPYVTVVDNPEEKKAANKGIKDEELAAPVRAINLAPMPSINRQQPADNLASTPAPQPIEYENVKIGPKAEAWQELSVTAKGQSKLDVDKESAQLIRLTTLPGNGTLHSMPAGSATASNAPRPRLTTPQKTQATAQEAQPQDPAHAEACAAIEAYRKRQLEAIANDNRTLAALHEAILNLGVSNKINLTRNNSTDTDNPAGSASVITNSKINGTN